MTIHEAVVDDVATSRTVCLLGRACVKEHVKACAEPRRRTIAITAGGRRSPRMRFAAAAVLSSASSPALNVTVVAPSRSAQPARARAFIDLVVARLADNAEHVLSAKDLRSAARGARALAT